MLTQVYQVSSSFAGSFFVLLREDDCNITMSMTTVRLLMDGKFMPVYSNASSSQLFLPDDEDITLIDTVPEEQAFDFLKLYMTLLGET